MKPKTIVILVVIALFLFVLLRNMHDAEIYLFFWKIEMPLLVLIISTLLLGWVAGWFSHIAYRRGKSKPQTAPEPQRASEANPSRVTPTPPVEEKTPDK